MEKFINSLSGKEFFKNANLILKNKSQSARTHNEINKEKDTDIERLKRLNVYDELININKSKIKNEAKANLKKIELSDESEVKRSHLENGAILFFLSHQL